MKTIQLTNKTHYFTKDIEKVFRTVLEKYKRTAFDFKFDKVRVVCEYRKIKDGFCGGYAYYHNNLVVMKLPKSKVGYDGDTFEQRIARTFHHELDHCRGKKHGDMTHDRNRDVSYITTEFVVKEKKAKEKKKKDTNTIIESLNKRKKKWESKLLRAKRALRVIDKKIKYHTKKKLKQVTF